MPHAAGPLEHGFSGAGSAGGGRTSSARSDRRARAPAASRPARRTDRRTGAGPRSSRRRRSRVAERKLCRVALISATLPRPAASQIARRPGRASSGTRRSRPRDPRSPTVCANSRVKLPGPHATSSTTSPAPRPSSRRAMRISSAIPGPVTPLTTRASAGSPVALVDRGHEPRRHQVLRRAGRLAGPLRAGRGSRHALRRARGRARPPRGRAAPGTVHRRRAGVVRWSGMSPARVSGRRRSRPDAARVARVAGELLEARDLPLALHPHRVAGGQPVDQALDPVADLEREVGRRRTGEGANVLDRDPMPPRPAGPGRSASLIGSGSCVSVMASMFGPTARAPAAGRGAPALGPVPDLTCATSARSSTCAWKPTEIGVLVADQPDVVVDRAGRVAHVARLDVEQVAPQRRPGTCAASSVTRSGPQSPLADSGGRRRGVQRAGTRWRSRTRARDR